MKSLHLLRHAKSSWADASLADRDRPLAPRGQKATRALARHFHEARVQPALVLCSTAVRARQTLEGVAASLGDDVAVWFEDDLYGADAEELLERLRALPPAVPSVMVVGHNPALEDLAMALIGGGDEQALARMHEKFPTGALASLLVEGDWRSLATGAAALTAFVVPKDLA